MKLWLRKIESLPPIHFVADIVRLYFSKRVGRSAAHLAYFLILTFFPILICVSAFVGRLNLSVGDLLDGVFTVLPSGVSLIFQEYLSYLDENLSIAMLIAGIVLTVLFASAAIRGLLTFMHDLYGKSIYRGPRQVGASIAFALLLIVAIYLSMVVVVSGNWFFHMLGDLLGLSDLAERFGVWQWLKYILLLAIMFLFILLLYRFASPTRRDTPPIIPGALLASAALVGASAIFAVAVSGSAQYSLVYGSLASVIVMLVWLYLCGNIILLGNVVNYVIFCRRQKRPI